MVFPLLARLDYGLPLRNKGHCGHYSLRVFSIIALTDLELSSNFAWLAVVISLWGLWLLHRGGNSQKSLVCAIAAEVIPLAIVTALLLPAISITDDLHACQLPAEIRRSEVQSDCHSVPTPLPGMLPVALALFAIGRGLSDSQWNFLLAVEQPAKPAERGHFRAFSSRPPPSSL
ncbi:MAG TPA: hypothetical protein VG844_19350 [Terracidiphilus sp.]|nr:hypothetical protein [Terracidiphilus sp.]